MISPLAFLAANPQAWNADAETTFWAIVVFFVTISAIPIGFGMALILHFRSKGGGTPK